MEPKAFKELHVDAKARIKVLIRDLVSSIEIENGEVREKYKKGAWKNIEKLNDILKSEYFNILDTVLFIHEEVENSLWLIYEEKLPNISGSFKELGVADSISNSVFQKLLEYPIYYHFLVELPNIELPFDYPIRISDSISIIKIDKDLYEEIPEVSITRTHEGRLRNVLLDSLIGKGKFDKGSVCLSVCFRGYLHAAIKSNSTYREFLRLIKQLASSLIVMEVFQPGKGLIAPTAKPLECQVYSIVNNGKAFNIELPPSFSSYMGNLVLNNNLLSFSEEDRMIFDFKGIDPDKPETQHRFMQAKINDYDLPKLFDSYAPDRIMSETERIRTSLEWYFEGMTNENETFSYILLSTGIEALLGDPKKKESITDRLSDRCAFLLARNSADRSIIKEEFELIYDIRSKIIHKGKTKLEVEEESYLYILRHLMKNLLNKEIKNLP